MKNIWFALAAGFLSVLSNAQDISLGPQKKPLMDDTGKTAQWQAMKASVQVSFANNNTRYTKDRVPDINLQNSCTVTAWKAAKVHTQLAVWGKRK